MQATGLIVAGGRGTRLGADMPKQFLELAGQPVLAWAVGAFQACSAVRDVVVVVAEEFIETTKKMLAPYEKVRAVVAGGAERPDSVRAGLAALLDDTELVAIHDAARPLISPMLIERVLEAAAEFGAALPAVQVRDTVKKSAGEFIDGTLDRRELYLAQTPQTFRVNIIRDAFTKGAELMGKVTDDVQLVEALGHRVRLVEGEMMNFKITMAEDLRLAAALLHAPADAG